MADDFVWNRAGLEQLDQEIAKDLERRAIRVESAAKRLAPVDTGRLRASVTHEVGVDAQGPVARVGTNVDYALPVELGHRNVPGKHFLTGALGAAK